jgi:two-component system, NtrC family, sensor kinase
VPSCFVIQGRDQGARFDLPENQHSVTIGRDLGNAVLLHDTEVSRKHAEILLVGESIVLNDLGSANGTWVNSQRIDRHELQSGDQIQVGRTILLFTKGSESLNTNDSQIRIVTADQLHEPSRILKSVPQQQGSQLFALDIDPTQSNWLARARSNLQIMYRTTLAVSHTLDIDELLNRLLQMIFEWVEADRGCVMLWNDTQRKLIPKVRRDRVRQTSTESQEPLSISQTILDYVLLRKEGVLTSNASADERFDAAASIVRTGVREAICVPLMGRYGIVGVIYIDTLIPAAQTLSKGSRKFNDEHLKLMVAIGHQAALAVEDTNYYSAMLRSERLAAMGQTIATLSHHIKNILQGIKGGSYLIDMGLSSHDEPLIRKGWDIVERNQKRISNMVLDMLTFSKEREPELGPGDLNQVVGEVVELLHARANDKKVQLVWNPDLTLPRLIFDEEGLHRAVLNILTNAIDAVEERVAQDLEASPPRVGLPARVVLRTNLTRDARQVQIWIEDTGAGIEPERLSDIFNLFVSSKGARGTGLGLPVSQKILREHGGDIRATSQLGQGSQFLLEFPAQRDEGQLTREITGPRSASITRENAIP